MESPARPVVVASKCLEIAACRYNGVSIRAPFIRQLEPFVELVPICPEEEIGLGTPRDPVRLVELGEGTRLVQPSTGRDLTGDMEGWSERYLDTLPEVDGFVLKSRSPSCGIKDTKVYAAAEKGGPIGRDAGLFARAVMRRFPHAAIEDEGRLTNFRLRHHFLARLFRRAHFRAVRASGKMGRLVDFHADNKLLLMACHQTELRTLGRIVANADTRPFEQVAADYEEHLSRALAHPPTARAQINALMHALGFFKKGLTAREKAHFLDALTQYREGRTTLSGPLTLLASWVERFGEPYLARQTYLAPYPRELMTLADSGGVMKTV